MIITSFTYGLLEGKLFRKSVGRDWANAEDMITKIHKFLRQEDKGSKKA